MSQDMPKAYDYAHRHMAQEMALRRLGVPEDIIHMFIEVHRCNSADMLTAYGNGETIHRLAQVKAIRRHVEVQYYDMLRDAEMETGGEV